MTEPRALELDQVSFAIGGALLTDDVSLAVSEGERLALIGPNGAGKTTLMNLIAGVHRPSSGTVALGGRDITTWNVQRRARAGLARTFQITNLLTSRTVAENLAIAVGSHDRSRANPITPWRRIRRVWRRVDELIELGGLGDIAENTVGTLSYGRQRRLEVIVALARPARVILLDEPGAGLTIDEAHELLELVTDVAGDVPIVFIDHDLSLIQRLATRLILLEYGSIVIEGTPDDVTDSDEFRSIYLEGDRRA